MWFSVLHLKLVLFYKVLQHSVYKLMLLRSFIMYTAYCLTVVHATVIDWTSVINTDYS